jgi:hypothetical protein
MRVGIRRIHFRNLHAASNRRDRRHASHRRDRLLALSIRLGPRALTIQAKGLASTQ